jgi:hypothetical protein
MTADKRGDLDLYSSLACGEFMCLIRTSRITSKTCETSFIPRSLAGPMSSPVGAVEIITRRRFNSCGVRFQRSSSEHNPHVSLLMVNAPTSRSKVATVTCRDLNKRP